MREIVRIIHALRIPEVFSKLGFVLIGAVFAIQEITPEVFGTLFKIGIYSFANALAIFSFNAWRGYEDDRVNLRLSSLHFLSKSQLGVITLFLVTISLYIILIHSWTIICTACGVLLAWLLYNWPGKGLKGIPFGGLLVSFATEILLFHLSYLFFKGYNRESIAISVYFAFLVAAGHANHEILDADADSKSSYRTTAVAFGKPFVRNLQVCLFILALIWLISIYCFDWISPLFVILFSISNLLSLAAGYYFMKKEKYLLFRGFYLSLYGLVTAIWFYLHGKGW